MSKREIKVLITGDNSQLSKSLTDSATAVAKWGAASVAAAGAVAAAMVKSGLDSADAMAKQARQLGITSKELAGLQRAADMAGISSGTLEAASRQLTTQLAHASRDAGTAVGALERLGLSQAELAKMPLPEQMATINKALTDQVPAAERAAVAAELYGARAGLAMAQLDPATIAAAADQVDRYGAALSEVDAAKIEAANDAISESRLAYDAVTRQLAAQFAPVLTALAERFNEVAGDGEMLTKVVEKFYDIAITGIGWVMDAYRGWQVILKGVETMFWGLASVSAEVYRQVFNGFETLRTSVLEGVNVMIRAFNRIPYVDIDEIVIGEAAVVTRMNNMADNIKDKLHETATAMNDLLMAEMPSEGLKRWVSEAERAAQEAAEAVVASRETILDIPPLPASEAGDTGPDGEAELERRRATAERMLLIMEQSLMDEMELAESKHQERLQQLDEFLELEVISREYYHELTEALEEEHEDKLLAIQERANRRRQQVIGEGLRNLSGLMQSENKKIFAIGKAAALSQAVLDGKSAVQSAFSGALRAGFPYPVAVGFGAAAAANSAINIAKIAGSSPTGGGSVSAPAASAPAASGGGSASAGPDRVVRIQGDFDSGRLFTGDAVQQLMQEIERQQADGYRVVL